MSWEYSLVFITAILKKWHFPKMNTGGHKAVLLYDTFNRMNHTERHLELSAWLPTVEFRGFNTFSSLRSFTVSSYVLDLVSHHEVFDHETVSFFATVSSASVFCPLAG